MKNRVLKITIILSYLFFGSLLVKGQNYFPFPDSNAVWCEVASGCCVNSCPGPPNPNPVINDNFFSYFLSGDTLINGSIYHKLYQSGVLHDHCSIGNFVDTWSVYNNLYAGALRQDTALRHVYFMYASAGVECKLYDFSLTVGDTLSGICLGGVPCAAIYSIDSVLVGGNYHRRFNLNTSPSYSIIEGIGSTSGLLEPLCPFEYFGTLNSFALDGVTVFTTTTGNCNNVTSEQNLNYDPGLKIFPNPSDGSISIKYNSLGKEPESITIYDCIGKQVKTFLNNQERNLNLADLNPGIYFILVKVTNSTYREKFIIK